MSNRRFALFIFLMALFISLLIINDIRTAEEESDAVEIALLTEAKYGEAWEEVIAGANQAANEYGVVLKLLAPDYARTYEEQMALLKKIKGQVMDGIIIAPMDPVASGDALLEFVNAGIPVISIVKDMDYLGVVPSFSPDQYIMGQQLAQVVLDTHGETCKVTLLMPEGDQIWIDQREAGFRDWMASREGLVITKNYKSRNDIYSAASIVSSLLTLEAPDIIVCFDRITTMGASDTVKLSGADTRVVGVDITDNIVNYIDEGIIEGIVAQDYFSMGYLSVQAMVKYLSDNKPMAGETMKTGVVTPDNLYSKEVQMIYFPID